MKRKKEEGKNQEMIISELEQLQSKIESMTISPQKVFDDAQTSWPKGIKPSSLTCPTINGKFIKIIVPGPAEIWLYPQLEKDENGFTLIVPHKISYRPDLNQDQTIGTAGETPPDSSDTTS